MSHSAARGERLWIIGPTGSGKSLLLQAIAGVQPLAAGQITLDGVEIAGMAPEQRAVGWLPQEAMLFPNMNARENAAFGGAPPAEAASQWEALVTALEMGPLLERRPQALSGGEQQRVALARALWRQPRILLLDEPLAALGTAWRPRLEGLVAAVRQQGAVVVETAHGVPAGMAGAVIGLSNGRTAP